MNRNDKNSVDSNAQRISLAGCVVVASPSLTDSVFGRSVCIVVEHTPERAVGIVLNKRINADVRPIWDHILAGSSVEGSFVDYGMPNNASPNSSLDGAHSAHVNFGGPLSGPIIAIHQDKELAEGGNELGVYLAAEAENLRQLVTTEHSNYRLFIGHAIWAPSELESQVVEGHWHVLPAVPELVFDDEAAMWTRAIRTVGNDVLETATGLPVSTISGLLN